MEIEVVDTKLVKLSAGVIGDILGMLQLPGGNTLAVAADAWTEKRTREATDAFIDEISHGYHGPIEFSAGDVDPMLEVIHRFNKAVEDGAAIENLKLLAQVIAGLKKNKALSGNNFRRWASILEQATRDELVMIGFAYSAALFGRQLEDNSQTQFWKNLEESITKAGYTKPEFHSIAASVSRYGLLIPTSAFSAFIYIASPWLIELGELANTEAMKEFSNGRDRS
ncbi:hypothetical protein [Rhizobium sp. A37_96]